MNGAVRWRWRGVGRWCFGWIRESSAHEEVAASSGACVFFGEVRGVAVYMKNHVAGVEAESCVGMGGGVIEDRGYPIGVVGHQCRRKGKSS